MMQAPLISASRYDTRTAGAVIGMAKRNRLRAIELLRQHGAYQEMRPGRRAERQHKVGPVDHRPIQPLSPANQEADRTRQFGPLPQLPRQGLAIERLPTQIERHGEG